MHLSWSLRGIFELFDSIRFIRVFRSMSLMVFCTSLFVCESVRKSRRNKNMTWIESLFMCFLGQFGGTTIASVLIGQPIRFLTSDKLVVALLIAWITIFCTPFDWGLKCFQIPAVRFLCRIFQLLSISFSVTAYGVDYVFKSDHPKAMVGLSMLIVTGTISGCGGGVLLHYLDLVQDDSLSPQDQSKMPEDLIRPTFAVKRAFFATLFYIYLLDPLLFLRGYPLFDANVCHFLTFMAVALSTALKELGWNMFDSVSTTFHKITQIPKEIPAFARRWSFEDLHERKAD